MACPLITFLVSVFFNLAIIACYCIGWILVFVRFFSHHRFLGHRQDIGFFLVFTIIAFYSIGRILVFIFSDLLVFLSDKILKRILVFKLKKKLTDIGLSVDSSQTLDFEFFGFNQDFG